MIGRRPRPGWTDSFGVDIVPDSRWSALWSMRSGYELFFYPDHIEFWPGRLGSAITLNSFTALIIDRFVARHWSFRPTEVASVNLVHRGDGKLLRRDSLVMMFRSADSSVRTWRLLTKRGDEILGRFQSLHVPVSRG